jgi:PilZ domain
MTEERRKSPRAEVDEIAYIFGQGSSMQCWVRNLSPDGAAIDVPDPIVVPRQFQLMTKRDRVVRACRIIWIRQNRIGVEFKK